MNSQKNMLRGRLTAEGCALIELDDDGVSGAPSNILKLCGLENCSFEGFNGTDRISRQVGIFSCHKANNGLRDSEYSDEFSTEML